MARNQRWYAQQGTFRSGILSPAAQEQVDKAFYQEGAAQLRNFRVLRDGGIVGRPGLVRHLRVDADDEQGNIIPSPRYGLLAGQVWSTSYHSRNVDDFQGRQADDSLAARTIPEDLYATPGGIARIERVFILPTGTQGFQDSRIIRFSLAAGGAPRVMTFHGVQLVQGSWHSPDQAGTGREMTLKTRVTRRDGSVLDTILTPSGNPLERGQFAPGIIPRDLVIPLVPTMPEVNPSNPVDVQSVDLLVASPRASLPLTVAIQGVSCFSNTGGGSAVELGQHVFGDPYRLIPWTVGGEVFILALGMEWVGYYDRPAGRPPRFRQGGANVWAFTERQLRELTWTQYTTSMLLFHHDFPWPLEVVFPESAEAELFIRYLPLKNVPETPQDAVDRARRTTYVGQTLLSGTRPTNLDAKTRGSALLITWLSTGAPRYRVRWAVGTEAPTARIPVTWQPGNDNVRRPSFIIPNITPGEHYFVAVSGFPQVDIDDGESDPVTEVGGFQARFSQPATPANLSLTNSTTADGSIIVDWDDVAFDARAGSNRGYDVQWKLDTEPESAWRGFLGSTGLAVSSITPRGTIGQVYDFRVLAWQGLGDARNESGWTQPRTREARYLIPAVPGTLAATPDAAKNNVIDISWGAAARATGYELQWEIDSGGFSSSQQEYFRAGILSWETPVLTPGSVYSYRVRAVRGASAASPGAHAQRSSWSATRTQEARYLTPALPTGLAATRVATVDGRLRLSWNAAARADLYELQWEEDNEGFSDTRRAFYSGLSVQRTHTIGPLARFRLRAVRGLNSAGTGPAVHAQHSAWTVPVTATPRYRTPAAPASASLVAREAATDPSDGLMRVTWPAAAQAQSYEVQTQDAGRAWSASNARTLAQRTFDANLTPGNSVRMRVRSVRGAGSTRPEYSTWRTSAAVQCRNRPSTITVDLEMIPGSVDGNLRLRMNPSAAMGPTDSWHIEETDLQTGVTKPAYELPYTAIGAGSGFLEYMRSTGWTQPAAGWHADPDGLLPAINTPARPRLDQHQVTVKDANADQSRHSFRVAVQRRFANHGPLSDARAYRLMPHVGDANITARAETGRAGGAGVNAVGFDTTWTLPAGTSAVDVYFIWGDYVAQLGRGGIIFDGVYAVDPVTFAYSVIPPYPAALMNPAPIRMPRALTSTSFFPAFSTHPVGAQAWAYIALVRTKHSDGSVSGWSTHRVSATGSALGFPR